MFQALSLCLIAVKTNLHEIHDSKLLERGFPSGESF